MSLIEWYIVVDPSEEGKKLVNEKLQAKGHKVRTLARTDACCFRCYTADEPSFANLFMDSTFAIGQSSTTT